MQEPEKLGRRVVIKTQRKAHGGKGKERNGSTGKIGILFVTDMHNKQVEHTRVTGPHFNAVQKKLRSTGLIPTNVKITRHGETHF